MENKENWDENEGDWVCEAGEKEDVAANFILRFPIIDLNPIIECSGEKV